MWDNVNGMGRYSPKEHISSHLSVLPNFFAIRAISVGKVIDSTAACCQVITSYRVPSGTGVPDYSLGCSAERYLRHSQRNGFREPLQVGGTSGPGRCRIGPRMSVECTAPLELVQYTTITSSLDHHSLDVATRIMKSLDVVSC